MRIALSQFNVAQPSGFDDFVATIAAIAQQAATGGADLVVLPEYAAMALAGAFVTAPNIQAELDAVTSRADALIAALRDIATDKKIWVLGGSLPMHDGDGKIRNRAPLIDPAGAIAFQDKQSMTRFEAEQWGISGGTRPRIFSTPFGPIGISICYDAEFPLHVRAQVNAGAGIILVPSCTDSIAGFNRVRLSCRARALENQCYIAMAPLVGTAAWSGAIDENHGYAGVYGPPDTGFPEDGVVARGSMDQPSLVFADIDLKHVKQVRTGGSVLNHRDWPDQIPPCPIVSLA